MDRLISGHIHPSCDRSGDGYCFCPPNHHPLFPRAECGCEHCRDPRTEPHYTFSNPATGFPFVLRERGEALSVERSISMAIEFARDAADAQRLTDAVHDCRSIVAAAELLYREHGCDDIAAETGRVWSHPNAAEQRELECASCGQTIATAESVASPFHCNACLGEED